MNNNLLIYLQKSDAQYITSLKNYNKMGYALKKNAKGIKILVPKFLNLIKVKNGDFGSEIKPYYMLTEDEKLRYKDKADDSVVLEKQKLIGFSLGNVFDSRDTTMPIDMIEQELNPVLEMNGADEIMNCFIKAIYKDGFKVAFQPLDNCTKGYCDFQNKQIVVRDNLGNLMQLKVLIHEYAHALAHKHLELNNLDYEEHRNKYETEAESIAYTVSNYLGTNAGDYSLSYLYSWSKNKDFSEVDDSLNTIIKYSKNIIQNFEKFYNEDFGLYAEEYKAMSI